ncbi:SusD/RagB family nutrient-binding outer membrane lipoprotein [Flagellimonas marinaquae]|uniref:SusD/RagB family nutrient-binding outer membrane lipoprotein n=1 Tax=Flagellimonas aurea TaxID=2915619 RepID=A0ABS3G6Y0_9FLAO|nr:SusD/RagB family nutrient-binding outer membrane lipoprotein [Allomuricauda aurea]MAO18199.1 SusD/RagB family nutrient-binding outer membrane lipoprotein [Allomuricauda sp.]MBC72398.1 SusD/RagB family nutrient-binding outer membrane lipoprotein [Allomuricauda sp.]MBO0355177.1 SusD/RagB family nutrient-binding outer membrane lipoprotein [Allomuricauda aurea]UBZ15105.1 SusD/RagB family nutrient-binding outer membrane lipoprotein [Allomuricauda aquimarina]|tara:strand:- start:3411 stop:5087 length:1677 start_codon:yes stop_codon:yes gene_type:complete
MKKIIKYITVAFTAGLLLNSCETTDLDLRTSPNDLASDQADPNLLLNSIQLSYTANMYTLNDIGSELTRIDYMLGRNYFNTYPGNTFDDVWERLYSSTDGNGDVYSASVDLGIFPNVANLQTIDETSDIDYSFHIAVGQTLKAHMLLLLVDYLGKATLSEAGNPVDFPAPLLDEGQEVYTGALAILSEAEALFAADPDTQGAVDFFYDGDTEQWIKLINTIRLKAAVTTGDASTFNSIIAAGNYISDTEDDFQWQYGARDLQPDTRHPDYQDDYTPSGANIYQSNWLMNYMLDKNDPRIRYYFYRQSDATPGAAGEPADEETLACSLATPPPHYAGFVYCSVPNGYWGRSHGNNEGTPPDGFTRTAVGVYPAAGRFDDNSFDVVGLGLGGGGAGIEPIILASYVDFWRAEMAATPAEKAEFLESGMTKSIAKVQSFAALDASADKSLEPTEGEVTTYIDGVVADFLAASGDAQMNILSEQYWIALYGGGVEAFNYYRRTGFPTTLAPNWEANPGAFPRSFLYPQTEVITNSNVSQKDDLSTQVFWDTNPAGPAFPPAN